MKRGKEGGREGGEGRRERPGTCTLHFTTNTTQSVHSIISTTPLLSKCLTECHQPEFPSGSELYPATGGDHSNEFQSNTGYW